MRTLNTKQNNKGAGSWPWKAQSGYALSKLFLAGYVFSIVAFSNMSPETARYSQLIGFALTGVFIVETLRQRRSQIIFPPELTALTVFTVLSASSAFWAIEPSLVVNRSKTLLQLLIFFLVSLNIMVQSASIMPMVVGLLFGQIFAVVALALGIGSAAVSLGDSRYGSVLVNANAYGVCLTIGILICLYLCFKYHRRSLRVMLSLLILVFCQQIAFATGSRKAMLGVPIVFVWLFFSQQILSGKLSRRSLLALQALPILLYLVGDWLLASIPFVERLTEYASDDSFLKRQDMIQQGLSFWLDSWLFGHGTQQFSVLSYYGVYSHNNYVELLCNNGLVGFCAYYSAHFILLRRLWRHFRAGAMSPFLYAWATISIGLILFWDVAMVSYFDKLIWALLMLLSAHSLIQEPAGSTAEREPQNP